MAEMSRELGNGFAHSTLHRVAKTKIVFRLHAVNRSS